MVKLYDEIIEQAVNAMCYRKMDIARKLLKKAIVIDPSNTKAYLKLMISYNEEGFFEKSIAVGRELKTIDPPDRDLLLCLANSHFQLANYAVAEKLLKDLLLEFPGDHSALYMLGIITFEQGRWVKSKQIFQQIHDKDPDFQDIDRLLNQAKRILPIWRITSLLAFPQLKRKSLLALHAFCIKKNKFRFRQLCLRILIKLFPNEISFYLLLGQLISHIRSYHNPRYNEEYRIYRKALEIWPNSNELKFSIGSVHFQQSHYKKAIEFLPIMDERQSIRSKSLLNNANSNVALNNFDQAIQIYEEYLKNNHGPWSVFLNLALTRLRQAQYKEALKSCQSGLEMEPTNVFLLYFKAVIEEYSVNKRIERDRFREIFETLKRKHQWEIGIYPDHVTPINQPENELITIPCPVCGSINYRNVYNNGTMIVKCQDCCMIYNNPQPTLDHLIKHHYANSSKNRPLRLFFRRNLKRFLQGSDFFIGRYLVEDGHLCRSKKADFLGFERSLAKRPKMIELGASVGHNVYSFQVRGWEAEGIEISQEEVMFGQQHGINLRQEAIETVDLKDNYYDLVLLIHTIEHVRKPLDLIKMALKILKPGGMFLLSTPCAESLPVYFAGAEWFNILEHIHFFSRKTIIQLVEQAGFYVLDTVTYCGAHLLETSCPNWYSYGFNKLVVETLSEQDQGDVILVYCKKP